MTRVAGGIVGEARDEPLEERGEALALLGVEGGEAVLEDDAPRLEQSVVEAAAGIGEPVLVDVPIYDDADLDDPDRYAHVAVITIAPILGSSRRMST